MIITLHGFRITIKQEIKSKHDYHNPKTNRTGKKKQNAKQNTIKILRNHMYKKIVRKSHNRRQ